MQPVPSLIILPTAWLPSISYFALLTADVPIALEVFESYPKQTCRNRCYIATANKVLSLSVPVVKVDGSHTPTHRVSLCDAEPWRRNHWRTIESAYRNSAWYPHYDVGLATVINQRHDSLWTMNDALINHLARVMKLSINYRKTEEWVAAPQQGLDLRNAFDTRMPAFVDDLAVFPRYFQNFADRYGFQPDLSIIDLLFNCGPDAGDYLRLLGISLLKKLQQQSEAIIHPSA